MPIQEQGFNETFLYWTLVFLVIDGNEQFPYSKIKFHLIK